MKETFKIPQSLDLTADDLDNLGRFRITASALEAARARRVTDEQARELPGINKRIQGKLDGTVFPNHHPVTDELRSWSLRRDQPEFKNGKQKRKYIFPRGPGVMYFPPYPGDLLGNTLVPIIFVEAIKSVLALMELGKRSGRRWLAIAINGCNGWRTEIGRQADSDGNPKKITGPSPDLGLLELRDRRAIICLDSNRASNRRVQKAEGSFALELRSRGTKVEYIGLPEVLGVNGLDDAIAILGDEAVLKLLDRSQPYRDTGQEPNVTGLVLNDSGGVRACLANALAVLRTSAEWLGALAYNESSLHVITRRELPWPKPVGFNWQDYDDSRTAEWLQHSGIMVNSHLAAEAVQTIAKENSFHPIRDYLRALKWDGQPRLSTFLPLYFGVPDIPFAGAVGRCWMISAVARVFRPGCQADYTLMLEGPQGQLKSTALRTLAGDEWFTDHLSDLQNKDSRLELRGKWIVELAELDSLKRNEKTRIKNFLTGRFDSFRPPYGRLTENFPRECVFAATTNEETPFVDETGNRRFWPVTCGKIDIQALRRDRDQLWAEAYHLYLTGVPWWLTTEALNQAAEEAQDARYERGPWDDAIELWIQDPQQRDLVEPFDSEPGKVTVTDILIHGIGKKDIGSITQSDQNSVSRYLRHLRHPRWSRRYLTAPPRGTDIRLWFYVRQ
jgi:predicted P-loop ATPase